MTRWPIIPAVFLACTLAAVPANAAEDYCNDNPSAIIYCNDFEGGSWDGMEHEDDSVLVTSGQPGVHVFDGNGGLESTLDTDGTGASFGYRFSGVEQVYVRFYMRWDANWDRVMHHFFAIHGDRTDDQWSCHGTAGCRPNGTKCLNGTTVDSREVNTGEIPGEPFFYSYFPAMNCDPGANCANYADPQAICDGCANRGLPCNNGLECCWGNHFDLNQSVNLSMTQNQWYCVETMVKANSVQGGQGQPDGEMALWIDGQLVAHHTGMLWRNIDELLLNHLIVWNYFPEAQQAYKIWFDNLVISTAPIGPLGNPPVQPDGGVLDAALTDGTVHWDRVLDWEDGGGPSGGGGSSGCNCQTSSSPTPTAGLMLIGLLFLLALRRRKR